VKRSVLPQPQGVLATDLCLAPPTLGFRDHSAHGDNRGSEFGAVFSGAAVRMKEALLRSEFSVRGKLHRARDYCRSLFWKFLINTTSLDVEPRANANWPSRDQANQKMRPRAIVRDDSTPGDRRTIISPNPVSREFESVRQFYSLATHPIGFLISTPLIATDLRERRRNRVTRNSQTDCQTFEQAGIRGPRGS